MRKIITAGICMWLGLLSVADAQEVRVSASLEKDTILIGDQIRFSLISEQDENLALAFPMITDTLAKGLEIMQIHPADTLQLENGRIRVRKEYTFSAFDSGRYEIQAFNFQYEDDNVWKQTYTDYQYLTVMRVDIAPADTSRQYFDIKSPYSAPVSFTEVLPWGLLGLVLIALSWFLYRYFKARKEGKPLVRKETPQEPAHLVAFRDLQQLKDKKLWQQDLLKAYYTEITAVLRQYIYRQYGVQSPEQTSSETLDLLRKGSFLPEELWEVLSEILLAADMVKFAKAQPQPSDNVEAWDNAWHFVEKSYPLLLKSEDVVSGKLTNPEREEGGRI